MFLGFSRPPMRSQLHEMCYCVPCVRRMKVRLIYENHTHLSMYVDQLDPYVMSHMSSIGQLIQCVTDIRKDETLLVSLQSIFCTREGACNFLSPGNLTGKKSSLYSLLQHHLEINYFFLIFCFSHIVLTLTLHDQSLCGICGYRAGPPTF